MTIGRKLLVGCLAGILTLSACGQRESYLPGERSDLRPETPEPVASAAARRFAPPPAQVLTSWTHRGGNIRHHVPHAALSPTPRLAWSTDIGSGEGRRHFISADPIVAGGRIFTLDGRATVSAVSTNGTVLWQTDLTPAGDREDDASGGGLASDGSRVYVTSGFGRLAALDITSGAVIWTQRLGAAATSAPAVSGDTVYAVSTDSRGWAVDARTGRVKWQTASAPSLSGVVGGGAPSVTDRLVILPMQSAELLGVLRLSGLTAWSTSLTGQRPGRVYGRFRDVSGDPVVVGGRIYVGNPTGRTYALEAASGERIWTVDEGAQSPPLVTGGSVFTVSDQNVLLRLDAATGARIWSAELPYFEHRRLKRRRDITDHYGPVLAGGRLIVAGGDGEMRFFDPVNGNYLGSVTIPGGAATLPAIVGRTLYITSKRGVLHAFR